MNSVIIAHPGSFSLDQVKAIKVPAAWICAEGLTFFFFLFPPSLTRYHFVEDMFFSDSLRAQSEAELAGRKDKPNFVEYEFKEYEVLLRY